MPRQHHPHKRGPIQELPTLELLTPRRFREKVDPAADDTGRLTGRRSSPRSEPDGAQDSRTRVEEAQLPDDVREAALGEVGELERTSDQSPESGDIRTWLDTILDLPWSTKTTDWIDIQGSREVEATLRRLIEPAVADMEEGDTAEAEPAVADVEEADTAEVEPAVADDRGDAAEYEQQDSDVDPPWWMSTPQEIEPRLPMLRRPTPRRLSRRLPMWRRPTPRRLSRRLPISRRPTQRLPAHSDDATVKMPAVPKIFGGGRANVLNSRNSRSLDLSQFRLLRRKGTSVPGARRHGLGGAAYRRVVVRRE